MAALIDFLPFFDYSKRNKIDSFYNVGSEEGRGAFSVVHRAKERESDKVVAVKMIPRHLLDTQQILYVKTEIDALKLVNGCKQIISLIDIYEDCDKIYIITELLEHGSLLDEMVAKAPYGEVEASLILKSILLGLKYMHERGVIHRDLKPENILIGGSPTDVKIIDFGLVANVKEGEFSSGVVGTRAYLAPEVILHKPYNQQVDMWSVGCITYALLSGYHPFSEIPGYPPLYTQIVTLLYDFEDPMWDKVSDEAVDFILQLLVRSARKRLNVKEALLHPFISRRSNSSPNLTLG